MEKGCIVRKRECHMDLMRGYGILCIVLGHVIKADCLLKSYVFSFHVPLFIFQAGYFFEKSDRPAQKWAKALFVPYAVFGLISSVLFFFLGEFVQNELETNMGGAEDCPFF